MSQRMEALLVAQALRREAFEIRRRVRASHRRDAARIVADVLRDPSRAAGTMDIEELLLCVPKLGQRSVRRMLAVAAITRVQRVREITPGRREALAAALEGWAEGEDWTRRTA